MPQVIVELIPDISKLETATDQLASSGAVSQPLVEEMKRVAKAADSAAATLNKDGKVMAGSLGGLSTAVKGISKEMVTTFRNSMKQGLGEANKSLTDLTKTFDEVYGELKPLESRMGELEDRMYELHLAGKANTQEFKDIQKEVVRFRQTITAADAAVDSMVEGTHGIAGITSVISGVAASFAVAEGAIALMGDESKDLQESMVRLQAVMAVVNGVQEASALLAKRSAAVMAVQRTQQLAATAAANLETAAQSRSIVVRHAATAAQWLLNMAMNANPVFILIAAFAAMSAALVYFTSKNKEAGISTEALNTALERQKTILDNNLVGIQHSTALRIAQLKAQGKTEAEVHRVTMEGLREEAVEAETTAAKIDAMYNLRLNGQKLFINNMAAALKSQQDVQNELDKATNDKVKEGLQKQLGIVNGVVDAFRTAGDKRRQIEADTANFTADQAEKARQKAKEANDKRVADAKAAADKAKEIEAQRLADVKARIEKELLTAEEGSQRQLDLRVKLAAAEKDISAFGAKSAAEKELVYAQYLKNIGDLTTTFHKEQRAKALQAQVDTLQAELANTRIGAQEKEALSVELLNRQRELELSQVVANKEKEKEINARYDNDIAAKRLEIRQASFDAELLLEQTQGAARKRALEEVAASDKAAANIRLAAVQDLALADIQSVNKQLENARRLHDERLLNDTDYNQKHAELQDQLSQIAETAEKRRTEINKAEVDKQKEKDKERALLMMDTAEQLMGSFNAIAQGLNERAMQQFDAQKKALDQQLEAGAITEKEHKARTIRIEKEEAAAKRRAAVRDKAVALFGAAIAGARAIVESIKGGPVMIAIASALVAAQIAAIAARRSVAGGRVEAMNKPAPGKVVAMTAARQVAA